MTSSGLGLAAAGLVAGLFLAAPPVAAQDPGASGAPVAPDSADVLRARMERPPNTRPTNLGDVIAFPLDVAAFPLRLAFDGLAEAVGYLVVPERYRGLTGLYDDVRALGLQPEVSTDLGPRGGVGLSLGYEGLDPLVLETAASIRGSQRHRIGLQWEGVSWSGTGDVTFLRHGQEHFWGIGPDTPSELRSDFRLDRWSATGAVQLQPTSSLTFRLNTGAEENEVAAGLDDARPDLREVFESRVPFGADRRTRYWKVGLEAVLDRTRWRELQLSGFRAGAGAHRYTGIDDTPSDFTRWTGWAHGYLPVTTRHLVAVRGRLEASRGRDRGIPFFHLPALGGGETLRAYEWGRFRDRDLLAVTGEWRFEVWRDLQERGRIEGFAFWEEGGVAHRLEDLDTTHSSYGLGLLLAWDQSIAAQSWIARGDEGTRISASLSAPFRALIGERP